MRKFNYNSIKYMSKRNNIYIAWIGKNEKYNKNNINK